MKLSETEHERIAGERRKIALAMKEDGKKLSEIGTALGCGKGRAGQIVQRAVYLRDQAAARPCKAYLSNRTINALEDRKWETDAHGWWQHIGAPRGADADDINALAAMSRRDVLDRPNLGRVGLAQVEAWLASHGRTLLDGVLPAEKLERSPEQLLLERQRRALVKEIKLRRQRRLDLLRNGWWRREAAARATSAELEREKVRAEALQRILDADTLDDAVLLPPLSIRRGPLSQSPPDDREMGMINMLRRVARLIEFALVWPNIPDRAFLERITNIDNTTFAIEDEDGFDCLVMRTRLPRRSEA